MKFIAVIVVAIAVSATADDHEYPGYQTNYDQTYQDLAAYNTGYDTNSLTSAYTSVTEKQDELDMDVILPIAVFGGFGLAALAFVENLSFRNRLCEKLREITEVGRDAAANAAINANLADVNVVAPGNINNEVELNTLVNSNRIFINALAEIEDMDC